MRVWFLFLPISWCHSHIIHLVSFLYLLRLHTSYKVDYSLKSSDWFVSHDSFYMSNKTSAQWYMRYPFLICKNEPLKRFTHWWIGDGVNVIRGGTDSNRTKFICHIDMVKGCLFSLIFLSVPPHWQWLSRCYCAWDLKKNGNQSQTIREREDEMFVFQFYNFLLLVLMIAPGF